MTDRNQTDNQSGQSRDEATDSRTLDKLEETEKISTENPRSTIPSPDEGSGRAPDGDARDQT
jgi:hypothetical protein